MIGHREDRGEDRGGVYRPHPTAALGFPVDGIAGPARAFEDGATDHAVPLLPRFATDHILRGGSVKVSVHIPLLRVAMVGEKIFGTFCHQRIVIMPADLQGINRCRRAGGGP